MKHLIQSNRKPTLDFLTGKLSKLVKPGLMLVLLMGFTIITKSQTTITAVQTGPWNDPNTWDEGVPTATDYVIIGNGYSVQVNAAGAVCSTLLVGDINGNGAITFSGTSSLTVSGDVTLGDFDGGTSGTIDMDANATLTCSTVIEADPLYSGAYLTNQGTIVFNGTFSLPYNLYQFNNLVINGSVTTSGRNLPIEGDLTVNNGGTLDLQGNTANRNTIAGTLTIASGATLRIGGGGTIPANFSTHVIGATSVVEYYGGAQTVATLNSSQNYGFLIISGSGLKEVNGSIGIARDLTINGGTFSVNTFSANRTSAGGTLTVANGAGLRIAGSGTIPSNFSTHSVGATSTIEYTGTSVQTVAVLNSSQDYGNLTVTNQVKNLGGSIRVRGTLTFGGSPNKLSIGSNTLTLEGTISGSNASRNITGSSSSNLVINGAFNRNLFFDATTIGTTNLINNLTINHSGNTSTLGNDLVVNSTLTFTAGKLAIAARTLTIKGDIVNTVTGGITGGTNSKLVFNGSVSPTLSMDQTTPGTTNMLSTLQLNSSGQVITMGNDLQMNSTLTFTDGKLAINGNTITLKGLVTNTVTEGLRAGSTSNIVVNGTVSPSLSIDQTTPGTTNVIRNFTVNSSSQTVTLLNALRLVGTHTPTAGVFESGGNYTIASTASGTANIAAGSTSGGYITGDVTVERYIPQNSNRAWRLLSVPANGQTIKEAWQENQAAGVNGLNGYGTNITSNSSSWSSNGFDFQTPRNSMLSYDQTNDELVGVGSTSAGIAGEQGYFIYIRGNRSITPSSSIAAGAATTLRTRGTLNLGDQSAVSVPADKFGLIGNPYPSAIDLRNVATTGGCSSTAFYVWDPKLNGSYSIGAFQTLTPSGGNYIVVPGGGSYGSTGTITNNIESGAAFFVQSTGSTGTVTVNESSKTSGSNMVFRPNSNMIGKSLVTNLYAITGGNKELADGNVVFFDDVYSNTIDGEDSRKMSNFGENLSIMKNTTELVIERRAVPVTNDTITFAMYQLKKISYQLQILADQLHHRNMLAFLEDSYLNTSSAINLDDTTNYTFTVDANAGSFAENRFRIVFKPSAPLPVTFTSISAAEQSGKIAVEWKVNNQLNIRSYSIEKSRDGRSFTAVGTQSARGSSTVEITYNWMDAQVDAGANYYRIKSVDANGQYKFTTVVKVILGKMNPSVTVSPNPVSGSVMNLQLVNQVRGRYGVRLTNSTGQSVYSAITEYNGGNTTQSYQLPAGLNKGVYQLEVTGPDNNRQVQKIIINRSY